MGIEFSQAKSILQISKSQFEQLDALDGEIDNKIENSIFEQAKQLRENQEIEESANPTIIDKIKNIFSQGRTIWNNAPEGTSIRKNDSFNKENISTAEISWRGVNSNGGEQIGDEEMLYFGHLGEELASYYLEHGTHKGFSITGVPANIEIKKFNISYDYYNGKNDSLELDDEITTQKNPDGIIVDFSYIINGKEERIGISYPFNE